MQEETLYRFKNPNVRGKRYNYEEIMSCDPGLLKRSIEHIREH